MLGDADITLRRCFGFLLVQIECRSSADRPADLTGYSRLLNCASGRFSVPGTLTPGPGGVRGRLRRAIFIGKSMVLGRFRPDPGGRGRSIKPEALLSNVKYCSGVGCRSQADLDNL